MDSLILETVVGLVFVFATFAALVAFLTEAITRFIGLRAEYLLRGLRTLLDGGGDLKLPVKELIRPNLARRRAEELSKEVHDEMPLGESVVQAAEQHPEGPTSVPIGSRTKGSAPEGTPSRPSAVEETSSGALVSQVLAAPLIQFTHHGHIPPRAGDLPLTSKDRRSLPSYISGRIFARASLCLSS